MRLYAATAMMLFMATACSQPPSAISFLGEEFFDRNHPGSAFSVVEAGGQSSRQSFANNSYQEPEVSAAPVSMIQQRELSSYHRDDAPPSLNIAMMDAGEPKHQRESRIAIEDAPAPMAAPSNAAEPASSTQQYAALTSDHEVQVGETVYRISRQYQVSEQELLAANGMQSHHELKAGQRLIIPQSGQDIDTAPRTIAAVPTQPVTTKNPKPMQVAASNSHAAPRPVLKPKSSPSQPSIKQAAASEQFIWPTDGKVIAAGDVKNSRMLYSDGVNIMASEGTPIKAAKSGKVRHVGRELEGYGNLIILEHDGGWLSAYAHTQNMRVKMGDEVAQGDVIAFVGKTGHVDKPQLHFSLRQGSSAKDPIALIDAGTKVSSNL